MHRVLGVRHTRQEPQVTVLVSLLPLAMQTINRFLYGPTAEEKVRAWQAKLRSEQRVLDREMRQVRNTASSTHPGRSF